MKYTSASANKLIKKLNEEKEYYETYETLSKDYVAAVDEVPVIPEFNYGENAKRLEEIDLKIVKLKHAINLSNALSKIDVNGTIMSVDEILVRMTQLNRRLQILDTMRKALPKSRVSSMVRNVPKPEYTYINYDLEEVKRDYDKYTDEVQQMQLALDRYNQTFEFEVGD